MVSPPFYQGPPHSYFSPPLGSLKQRAAIKALKWQYGLYGNPVSALAVGAGNFATRNFRQKPIVGLTNYRGTTKAIKPTNVSISTVSRRRGGPPKNKILTTNKAMPYKRFFKRSTYRRKSYKGRPRRRRVRKLPPLQIPRSKIVRFRLVTNGQYNGSTGAINVNVLKANSLNDPTGAMSANLPNSLDQWATFYHKYIVLGSKIKVDFIPTTSTGPVAVGIRLTDTSTTLSAHDHYAELPGTKVKIITTQKDMASIVMKYSGKRFWRLTNIKDDSEQEGAFSTSPGDPTDIAYWHVFIQDHNKTDTANVEIRVTMEFICLLTEPEQLARSSL